MAIFFILLILSAWTGPSSTLPPRIPSHSPRIPSLNPRILNHINPVVKIELVKTDKISDNRTVGTSAVIKNGDRSIRDETKLEKAGNNFDNDSTNFVQDRIVTSLSSTDTTASTTALTDSSTSVSTDSPTTTTAASPSTATTVSTAPSTTQTLPTSTLTTTNDITTRITSITTTLASTSTPSPTTTSTQPNSTETSTSISITTSSSGGDVDHPLPGWALALILLSVTGVLLAGVFIVFLKYRRSRIPLAKPVQGLFRKSTVDRSPRPIRAANFHKEYQNRLSNYLLAEEFERVQEFSARINASKPRTIGQAEKNRNRNRFVDIIPFDDNYVQLEKEEGSPASDYVNASYINNVHGVGKVIATQGPKQNTVVEFWRMVIEKGSRHIINLTNNMEGGRVKCFQYWPPNGQMLHFDDISLFTQDEKEMHPGLFIRKIEVQLGDEPEADVHVVEQLHLTTWPDHSVPSNINSLIAFLNVCDKFGGSAYTTIHCSAGVGRTGTLVALRSLLHAAREGLSLDVMKTVFQLRALRPKLVQTFEQYALLYQVMDAYLERDLEDEVVLPADDVLDAGIDNFGFEHVKL